MASYTAVRAKHATLTANTVDTVDLSYDAGSGESVEVLDRGTTDPIYFTVDGSTPTVAGDDCFVVMPGAALVVSAGSIPAVKLKSAGAMAYSVTKID